jgi:hypothetical protein
MKNKIICVSAVQNKLIFFLSYLVDNGQGKIKYKKIILSLIYNNVKFIYF